MGRPARRYIVTYNGFQLPGYAQSEDDPLTVSLVDHYAFGVDGSISQTKGMENKSFSMDFKIWEDTYQACKNKYYNAVTALRSRRDGFARLFVDYTDRYFNATVRSITYTQRAEQSKKLLTYSVEFNTQPWMTGIEHHVIEGPNSTTEDVGRTLDSGGWTPALVILSGTNPTVSGYSATQFTGYISISGVVTDFEIDTENSFSTDDSAMNYKEYGLWVAPGTTWFDTTGVTDMTISYFDRWY